ncbi:MAG: tetratricopeptide repeat protein [Candidatus Rokubacteria bacterium]|nr:tetratricopeptide repeat protein [Candidatus Rokubacteria bacterium]
MKFRGSVLALLAFLPLLLVGPDAVPAQGEAERLWLVGSRAYGDQLYPLARRVLERFVERYPDDARLAEATLLLGKAQLELDDPAAGLESFRRAQRLAPGGEADEARFWEGQTLVRLKRYREARAVYDVLLAENAASPFAPDALYAYAWCELELKRPDPAVTAFRELIKAWPEHRLAPSAAYHLARTLVQIKQPEKAEEVLARFPSHYPGHPLLPKARYLLGWTRLATGKTDEGVADLRAFIADDPTHAAAAEARRAITGALLRQGRKPELLEEYRTLLGQSPPTPEALYDAALLARELGRPRDAEAAWSSLRREFPAHVLARRAALELAQAAFRRNQLKEAEVLAQEASESSEDRVRLEALVLLGESEVKAKRFQAALKAFDAALALKSGDAALRFRALAGSGVAHEELRHWAEAAERYRRLAGQSPDQALKQWAKARLAAVRAKAQAPSKPRGERAD